MRKSTLIVCFLSVVAGPALAADQPAMTGLLQSAGSNAGAAPPEAVAKPVAAPAATPPSKTDRKDQPKIVLRTGFYTTAALDCAFDVSLTQDGGQVIAAIRDNPESGASCTMSKGETLTLVVDKDDANSYLGRTRAGSAITVKVVNEASFIGGSEQNLYTLAKAADQPNEGSKTEAQKCPYVHTEMRTNPDCHVLTIGGFPSRWSVHCGDVPTVVTDMVPCDQIPQ